MALHVPPEIMTSLAAREAYRDRYDECRDPIFADRCRWRAQTMRHLAHILPEQKILELGAGRQAFTRELVRMTRGQNPITSVVFGNTPKVGQVDLPVETLVYAPLRKPLIWTFRNLSVLLENTPLVRTLAGSILVRGQKPIEQSFPETRSLFEHPALRYAVSVVIPCRNEETNVRPLVERLMGLYGEYICEIVLVDDSSEDGTAAELKALAAEYREVKIVSRSPPNGVGRALADGLRAASGRYVLTLDCDFVHLLPEMRDLFEAAAEGCDVVVGSRFSRHSVLLNYPFGKIVANRAFHLLAQLAFRRCFRDVTNNLKLFDRRVVDCLEMREPGFAANA